MLTCNKVWGFLKHFTDLSREWLQGRRFTSAEVCHVGIKNIFGQFVSRQCGDKGEARRMFKKVTLIFNNFFFIVATLCLSVAFNLFVQKVEDTPAQCKLWALNLDDEETERESIKENKSKSTSEVFTSADKRTQCQCRAAEQHKAELQMFGDVMQHWWHVTASFYELVCRTLNLSFKNPALVLSSCKSWIRAGCCRVWLFVELYCAFIAFVLHELYISRLVVWKVHGVVVGKKL